MSKQKGKLTDIQKLIICHFGGLVIISFFGANVFELAEKFAGNVGYLLLPINRSTWEMSKMLVMPMSVIFVIEYFIVGRKIKNFIPTHVMITALLPLAMIGVLLFYKWAFGALSMQGAQAVFFLALIIAAMFLSILLLTSKKDMSKYLKPFLALYIVVCVLYIVFSFIRPEMRIFFDEGAGTFGPLY